MLTHSKFLDLLVALSLFGGLVAMLEIWFYLGRRARRRREEQPDQLATIQGATLGLLALLLGFSFALAAGRFSDRVQLIVSEANAIGTAWLRSDLMPQGESRSGSRRGPIRSFADPDVGAGVQRGKSKARPGECVVAAVQRLD